jgi:hypothetical protein
LWRELTAPPWHEGLPTNSKTEMDGGGRKKVAGRLKDDPRQLGKGRVRLVGSAPLKPDRKVRRRRQDSPVPLAAFARGQ